MSKKTYSVSEFKSKSLGLLDRIARSHESIVVTKRGKPIAEVIPIREPGQKLKPGRLEGTLLSEGDIVSPLGSNIWQAAE